MTINSNNPTTSYPELNQANSCFKAEPEMRTRVSDQELYPISECSQEFLQQYPQITAEKLYSYLEVKPIPTERSNLIQHLFNNLFNYQGVENRYDYWRFVTRINWFLYLISGGIILLSILGSFGYWSKVILGIIVLIIILIWLNLALISAKVRRLHDIGLSGKIAFIFNWTIRFNLLDFILATKGTKVTNNPYLAEEYQKVLNCNQLAQLRDAQRNYLLLVKESKAKLAFRILPEDIMQFYDTENAKIADKDEISDVESQLQITHNQLEDPDLHHIDYPYIDDGYFNPDEENIYEPIYFHRKHILAMEEDWDLSNQVNLHYFIQLQQQFNTNSKLHNLLNQDFTLQIDDLQFSLDTDIATVQSQLEQNHSSNTISSDTWESNTSITDPVNNSTQNLEDLHQTMPHLQQHHINNYFIRNYAKEKIRRWEF